MTCTSASTSHAGAGAAAARGAAWLRSAGRPAEMKIALTAEGTYPHQFGGVSVWCDQLVRGMPDYDFLLVALTATGVEPVRWSLPENVTSVASVPLWGPPPPGPPSGRFGRRQRRAALPSALTELIELLLAPPGEAPDKFSDVLREVVEVAP